MAQSSVGTKQQSRVWMAVIGVVVVLAIVAAVAYYAFSGFFSANGTWYGPMKVKTGVATISIETYMDVSTNAIGGMSGTGTFCLPLPFNNSTSFDYTLTGNHAFALPGRDDSQAITLTAEYTVPVVLGFTVPIGPTLTMHGGVASSVLHLAGGDGNAATTLDMKHGSKDDFTKACKSLAPLG